MRAVYRTDVGREREQNQDSVLVISAPVGKLPNLLMVADGMGGHKAGDRASRTAVERIPRLIADSTHTNPLLIVTDAVREVNTEIYSLACDRDEYRGMGTTLTLGYIDQRELYVYQIGDSRCYVSDSDGLRQITHDHSYVEEMIQAGRIDRQTARTLPDKNIITRAVGAEDSIKVDFFREVLTEGDILLLCSDGLTNMVTDQEIARIVFSFRSLEAAADRLIFEANRAGGKDNISAILINPFDTGRWLA